MGLFQVLLVGHLIADFPLQTPTILRWKFRGGVWIFPHIIIHAAVLSLLVRNPVAVGVIAMTHFIIDWVKVKLDDGSNQGISFLMDQSAHVLVLALVARYGGVAAPQLTFDNLPIILGLAVISAVFMFFNVVKAQMAGHRLTNVVCNYAFHVSKIAGWAAVFSLLLSVHVLR